MANAVTDPFKGPLMRVSYAWQLFKTRTRTRDDGSSYEDYGCSLIAERKDFGPIEDAVLRCMKKQWNDKAVDMFKAGLIRNPILAGDGAEARNKETGEIHDGLGAGLAFIRVSTQRRPAVVAPDAVTPLTEDKDLPSGSWGYPVLHAYAWTNAKGGKGVSIGINAFQLVKIATGGEILGGGGQIDTSKYFEKIDTGGSATDAKPTSAAGLFG